MGVQTHAPAASNPGKDPVPIVQEGRWVPRPVWTGGKSRPHRDSIRDHPARSQSLYRLSYRAHYMRLYKYIYIYADVCTMYVVCTYDYVHICTLCVCVSANAKGLKLHVENQKSLSRELRCATQKRGAAYITERVSLLFPFLPHHTRRPLKGIFSEL